MTNCDACDRPAIESATDRVGEAYHACAEHVRCLAIWVRGGNYQSARETREAIEFERNYR